MAKDKPEHDMPVLILLMVFVIIVVGVMFWMVLSSQISSGIRWIRVGELYLVSLFTDRYDVLIKQLIALPPGKIPPLYLLKMTETTSELLRWPIFIINIIMTTLAFFMKENHPYSRRLDLEGLTKEQATAFPVTAPMVKFNPLTANFRAPGSPIPEKLPPFAEALFPEEWVAHQAIPITDGVIDRDAARLAFARQLGVRWKGVAKLPLYAQALFAAFSMKANGQRTEADEFLGEVAQCWEPGRGLQLTSVLRKKISTVISDPKMGRVTEKVAAQHSFTVPAMLHCLQIAREQGGVLAPAQFIWLRAVDRPLWYGLNNLGRGGVHTEGAGAISHYRAEKAAGEPIPNPLVEVAVDGLMIYLADNYITQFPAVEYAKKKEELKMVLEHSKQAFIRDGALVLYFDNAETPFVARYDLESLAQANFEVADKKEGFFTLTLRDFSGQVQTVGQFSTKSDAHQALYAILQALLSYKTDDNIGNKQSSIGRFILGLIKWVLILAAVIAIIFLGLNIMSNMRQRSQEAPQTETTSSVKEPIVKQTPPETSSILSTVPEGEAVDADSILAPQTTTNPTAE